MATPQRETIRARRTLVSAAILLAAVALVVWRYPPVAARLDIEHLAGWIGEFAGTSWAPVAMVALYVLAGFVVFPLMVLIGATAVLFDPLAALVVSFAGSLANAFVLYHVGARLAGRTMRAALGRALERVQTALQRRGIIAIALLRSLPVAPFTVVNLAAGSLRIGQRDYLLGTLLGLAPGILMITAFGNRLRALLQEPTPGNVAALVAILVAWFGVILVLQRLSARLATRRRATSSS